jgi:hypothetical protein
MEKDGAERCGQLNATIGSQWKYKYHIQLAMINIRRDHFRDLIKVMQASRGLWRYLIGPRQLRNGSYSCVGGMA